MDYTYKFNINGKNIVFTDREILRAFSKSYQPKQGRDYVNLEDVQRELFDPANKYTQYNFCKGDFYADDNPNARKKLLKQWALKHGFRETHSDNCYYGEDIVVSMWSWH